MSGYIQIGTIVASFGLKGEVVLKHEIGHSLTREIFSTLYVERNKNNYIPYFITSIREKNDTEVFLKMESVDSKETARTFLKKKVYLDQKLLESIVQPNSHLYYIGFTIIDKKENELGTIEEIMQLPDQLIAKVSEGENELLIPLTEQTIDRIVTEEKKIYVTLPEGLTDIYRP